MANAEPDNSPDRPQEILTTIVGGRPQAESGRSTGIPRGMEVLLKKASVDPDFRERLLRDRSRAAGFIDLVLTPVEAAMLDIAPQAQLEAVIAHTTVEPGHRAVFLGRIAAATLLALGVAVTGCSQSSTPSPLGITPDEVQQQQNNKEKDKQKEQPPENQQPVETPAPPPPKPDQPVTRGISSALPPGVNKPQTPQPGTDHLISKGLTGDLPPGVKGPAEQPTEEAKPSPPQGAVLFGGISKKLDEKQLRSPKPATEPNDGSTPKEP